MKSISHKPPTKELLRSPLVTGIGLVVDMRVERARKALREAEMAFAADPTEDMLARLNVARDTFHAARAQI